MNSAQSQGPCQLLLFFGTQTLTYFSPIRDSANFSILSPSVMASSRTQSIFAGMLLIREYSMVATMGVTPDIANRGPLRLRYAIEGPPWRSKIVATEASSWRIATS
jgi:hypothetical protein